MISEVQNLGRAFEAAGKPILQALVQFLQEPPSRVFQRLFLSPVLSSVPVFHAHIKAWSKQDGAPRNSASGA